MTRRTIVFAGGGTLLAQTAPSNQHVAGLIGSGGRGQYIMKLMMRDPAVRRGLALTMRVLHVIGVQAQ